MHFRLKTLFVLISICAVLLTLVVRAGFFVTLGVLLTLWALKWAIVSQHRGYFLLPRIATGLISLIVIWFLTVDWSWFPYGCVACNSQRSYEEYRVLGFPLLRKHYDEDSIFACALADLGVPCKHTTLDGYHRTRWWGLLICASPCICTLDGFPDGYDDRYTPAVSQIVRQKGKDDPEFAKEVYDHLINKQDFRFFWDALMTDVFAKISVQKPESEEAITWLKKGKEDELRLLYEVPSNKESLELIQQIYDAGALQVIVTNFEKYRYVMMGPNNLTELNRDLEEAITKAIQKSPERKFEYYNKIFGKEIFVELPENPADRQRLLNWIDQRIGSPNTVDGGQTYMKFWVN